MMGTKVRAVVLRRTLVTFALVGAGSVGFTGCSSPRTPPPAEPVDSEPPSTADVEPQGVPGAESTAHEEVDPAPVGRAATSVDGGEEMGVEPAEVKPVGPHDARRGSSIAGGGIISEPVRQRFSVQHRIVFLNLERAEKLYQASEGRMPESHEEYMKEIVEQNDIELPELQPGWEYYYDARDKELKQRKTD